MPAEKPVPITIYVKPYVRKYVLAKLTDPQQVAQDPARRALFRDLEKTLCGRKLVGVVNDFDPNTDKPSQRLQLLVLPGTNAKRDEELSHYQLRYLNSMVNKSFARDMLEWVTWYRRLLGLRPHDAMLLFRRHYSITEEDYSLHSAMRALRRYRKRVR